MAIVSIIEAEGYSTRAVEIYQSIGPVRFELHPEAEVLVIRLGRVTKGTLDKLPRLKIIASPTTGLDHIDLKEAERRLIRVISLKGRRDILEKIFATSELTVGLVLALLRRIPAAARHVEEGGFDRQKFIGTEIARKTVGIVGCGRLGIRVAEILHAMGAEIVGYDPYVPREKVPSFVKIVQFDELLGQSDVVCVHVALSDETTGMFGPAEFEKMKKGAFFVNTSRGQMVDETALLAALESGQLAGAALDVVATEQSVVKPPLHENLIVTPHIGGATRESMAMTEEAIANEVVAYFKKL